MTLQAATETQSRSAGGPAGFIRTAARPRNLCNRRDAEVLLEQLTYLIEFADQECDRLDRVKAILMETFN